MTSMAPQSACGKSLHHPRNSFMARLSSRSRVGRDVIYKRIMPMTVRKWGLCAGELVFIETGTRTSRVVLRQFFLKHFPLMGYVNQAPSGVNQFG